MSSAASSSVSLPPRATLIGAVDWSSVELVPDLLAAFPTHPLLPIAVEFPLPSPQSGTIHLPAYLSVAVSKNRPQIGQLPPFDEARKLLGLPATSTGDVQHYSLMMLDPDAISKTKHWFRSAIHWLHVNISDVSDAWEKTGVELASYEGAGPPPFTGYHRYVLFLFYHREPLPLPLHATDFPYAKANSVSRRGRMKFSVERFLSWFPAEKKPELVAVNYFLAQHWMQSWWGNPQPKNEEIPLKMAETTPGQEEGNKE